MAEQSKRFASAVQVEEGRALVVLRGELDLAHASALTSVVEQADVAAVGAVVLDLRELKFLDSSGLRALLRAQEVCTERGQEFGITEGSGQVKRLLEVTRAHEQLPIVSATDAQ
jgi:anti-sigma B factor antagonist